MFDLMGFFLTNFNVQTIYTAGWSAAQGWTAAISSSILALAIIIRLVQEQVSGSQADYSRAIKDFLLYGILTASFFFLVYLLINFFNAIYGTVNASDALAGLGGSLQSVFSYWKKSKWEFSISDLANGIYGGFAFGVFMLSYMMLVFVVFAMRIAHAILVSTAAFWAAIAIPMAPVNGLKSLSSLKVLVIVAFIWPIFDAYFMYLVASVFIEGLENAFDNTADTITAGEMVFVLFIYTIINLFMVAACFSAPFIAQGIANGTGNITGMLASFGGAGIAAGALAAKYSADKANTAGAAAGSGLRSGANGLSNNISSLSGGAGTPSASKGARAEFSKSGGIGGGADSSSTDTPTPKTETKNDIVNDQSGGKSTNKTEVAHATDQKTEVNPAQAAAAGNSGVTQPAESQTKGTASNHAGDPSLGTDKSVPGESTRNVVADQAKGQTSDSAGAPTKSASSDGNSSIKSAVADQAKGQTSDSAGAPTKSETVAGAGRAATSGITTDATQTQTAIEQQAIQGDSGEADTLAEEQAQKDKQARRGAIINKGRNK